jgi:uncharacterized damage-inducible protein DinB
MPGTGMLTTMLAYNHAANTRLLDLASLLDDAQLDTPIEGAYGTIRETSVHLAGVEWRWRTIVETHDPPVVPAPLPRPATIEVLKRFAGAEAVAVTAWLASRGEEDLITPAPLTWGGETVFFTPWHALVQLCMHGMQHRSEIAIALTRLGQSPGEIDFISFVNPE